jgi:hypothetical protein
MMRLLVIATLAACSTPASWRGPDQAGTVRIHGDLIVRAEGDETISVTARVALDDAWATGFVLLRTGDLATAATSKHVQLARARAWQALAAMLASDPERSYRAAKLGSDAIRVLYVGNDGIMRADLYAMNKDFPLAAREMASSLRASLRAYTRRFHDEVW